MPVASCEEVINLLDIFKVHVSDGNYDRLKKFLHSTLYSDK